MSDRPAVSVVMPFAGDPQDAAAAVAALERIDTRTGDELILVDNSAVAVAAGSERVRVVRATAERSSYSARNAGARAAVNDWLLFIDADTLPIPELLDAYLMRPPAEKEGALAGTVAAVPGRSLVARYADSRGYLSQSEHLADDFRPHAVTANLMVRRRAWASVGGFAQGVRSGGDSDFSWRLQEAGWRLGHRPEARVEHHHRERLRAFVRVVARYAAGRAWLRRRWPGAFPGLPGAGAAARGAAAAVRWLATGDLERGAFRALDALVAVTDLAGEQLANRPPAGTLAAGPEDLIVLADGYPVQSETFVVEEIRALVRAGHGVRIEAAHRPVRQALGALDLAPVAYLEDDSRLAKLAGGAWLLATHPRECIADLFARRRWRTEEPVLPLRSLAPLVRRLDDRPGAKLHCHFAGPMALTTLRVARLTGRSYAVTAHAYEIFREPANLREKLESAAMVFTGCAYNVDHLRRLAPRATVHEIVMGVDAARFTRSGPLPGGRRVIAVGRLVEKKGFADLIAAVARPLASDVVEELVIVGDGPLRDALTSLASGLGVAERVRFTGAVEPDAVRTLLEEADLLAMPCLIAADGDRDSMPVVVKEALALELMVVGSDAVGLPELIEPAFGRLVPPRDPEALARAIAELLSLGPEERAAAGRAGRDHVVAFANVDAETAKLAGLLQITSIR